MRLAVPSGWVETGPLQSVGLPTFADEALAQSALTAIGRAVIGLGAGGPPERTETYGEFLFPFDTPQNRADRIKVYSCALACAGILVRAGYSHHLIDTPYGSRTDAVTRLVTIGRDSGTILEGKALRDWTASPGDIAIVDGPEHAIAILELVSSDPAKESFRSCEGGLPDPGGGYQILERWRLVDRSSHPGETWLRTIDPKTGALSVGRKLRWLVQAWKLPFDQPAIVPASFAEGVS